MKKKRPAFFQNRILLLTLLPVLGVGIVISALVVSYLTPPLLSLLEESRDAELELASRMGLTICENNFNYLMDLRLEDEPEMNATLKKESIEEIKRISKRLPDIHMMIIGEDGALLGSSLDLEDKELTLPRLPKGKCEISTQDFWGDPVRIHNCYFPFWHWHIVSLISERDYMAPVLLAKRVVYLGTFGVLTLVSITIFLVSNLLVNLPVRRLIRATKGVAEGRPRKLDMVRRDEIGQLVSSFNSMVDSLEKKNAEIEKLVEALRVSEDKFRTAFHLSPDPIIISRLHSGVFVDVNESFTSLFGYEKEEIIGTSSLDISLWHDPEDRKRYVGELERNYPVESLEAKLRHKDGRVGTVLVSGTIMTLEGEPHILSVLRDIEEQKRAEQALRESEGKYRSILETIQEGYYEVDLAGSFTFFNDSLCKILGYSRAQLKGAKFREFTDAETAKKGYQAFNEVYTTGRPNEAFDWEIFLKDGGKRHVEASITLMKDADGQPVGFRGIIRDVSERKKLEARLFQSQKMEAISTLAGGIAHQFNNALAAMAGNLELLSISSPDNEKLMRYAEPMKVTSRRMAHLTNQLLAYARGGKYHPQTISLCDFVEDTMPLIKDELKPGLRVETDLPHDISDVKADLTQLQMVLSAIITNADEAIEEQGRIRITARDVVIDEKFPRTTPQLEPGPYVCLSIEDDGKGMDEETRSKIFDPFYTTKFQGRGLGMAAVYGIVRSHDGWISVDSEPGRGTKVSIYLPAIEAEIEEMEGREAEISAKATGTILVIEDEELVMDVTREMLERMGYRVLEARTGKAAVEIAEAFKEEIEIAILDIKLPDIGGEKVYPLIKGACPNMKVIVSSGYAVDGPAQGILDAGAEDFIQKPYSLGELAEKIREVRKGNGY